MVLELAHSSPQSWVSDNTSIMPQYQHFPDSGFAPASKRGRQLLAVALKGRFASYFKDKTSPLLQQSKPAAGKDHKKPKNTPKKPADTVVGSVIARSSDSARLVLIAANSFARDLVTSLTSQGLGTQYTRQQELIQNAIDWSLQDEGLLSIRSRARFARTLIPMPHNTQLFWEYLNYVLALLGLGIVWLWRSVLHKRRIQQLQTLLAEV